MDLYEYQARDLFEKHGVPVLGGAVATTAQEARAAAETIGAKSGGVTVVKAQVKTGGRGKAGGVKVAKNAEEAEQYAEQILGMDIKGHTVKQVMIAEGARIAEEYYFSLLLDRANRTYLAMCSTEGGVDIETLAVERPEALAKIPVDPNIGIDDAKAAEIVLAAGFPEADHQAIAEGARIAEEYYFSLLLDRANRTYLAMCSTEGGVDIETLAVERPEALAKIPVDPNIGIDDAKATEIVLAAGFPEADHEAIASVLKKLWGVYHEEDATLVEVNPLVKTQDGTILALDGKVSIDENSAFRHPEHEMYVDHSKTDPLEVLAIERQLNYVKLDGDVGIIGNGAGLVMSTLDVVAYAGQEVQHADGSHPAPANFLDIGGGANAQVMADGLDVIFEDKQVKAVFVNVFGGITACDAVADGIVQAYAILQSHGKHPKPLVVRLDGNNAEEGRRILDEAKLPLLERVDTMDGAARRVAELAAHVN